MKIWLLLLLITSCRTQVIFSKNPDQFGSVVSFKKEDPLGQYTFGYSEGHPSGATFRRESGDAFGNKIGSYGIKGADGILRLVQYIADQYGYRANIITNEPGVAPVNPASVNINKPAVLLPPAPAVPAVPVAPVAVPPPPPPLSPPVAVRPKLFPPPPVSYNYITPAAVPVAVPPPPPPSYFPPRYAAPVAPIPAPVAPVAVAPFAKGFSSYPPPPPAYYTNLGQGKGYVNAVRTYPSLLPPLSAVPQQYNYLNNKAPPLYQEFSFPL